MSKSAKRGAKPRLLDLFCGAGGCTKGYQQAGFQVVGLDATPQPSYCGEEFVQASALEWLEAAIASPGWDSAFAAIHASPPCQRYSALAAMHPERSYPDLIGETRRLLEAAALPYVIENVEGAPLERASNLFGAHGALLCGSMFGLGVERGYLRRHRLFETSFAVVQPSCSHRGPAVGVYGHGPHSGKPRMLRRDEAAQALEIDWMSRDEMAQAIPPAYTRFIGTQLRREVETG